MSATAEIVGSDVRVKFSAPWDWQSHEMFILSKRLPEARCLFDRESDSYELVAPARFAPLVGLPMPTATGHSLPLADHLFDYQAWIVRKAMEARRYAVWADCGLGKTVIFLEWARQVSACTGSGKVLIFSPKSIIPQTCEEARRFYPDGSMELAVLSTREDLAAWASGDCSWPFAITNYEKMIPGVLDEIRQCAGVVLDESSILKGGGGVIKWNLIKSCRGIEYKLSCTATPAPNDTMEYASQASFLEKLRNEGEILWTFFVRDGKSNEWKVRPHAREAFYRFMSSWSVYLRKPSAYGFKDQWDLPEPEIIEHRLAMSDEQARERAKHVKGDGTLFREEKLGVTARSKLSQIAKGFVYGEDKKAARIISLKPARVAKIVCDALRENRQILIWTVFDAESEIIMEHLRLNDAYGVSSLHGKDKESERESKLEDFRHGKIRALVSKARLLGYGMNFQFCTRMIFSGFDDSFEQFYQAVRRAHRYGSTERLVVHVPIIPELESKMWDNLLRKRGQWESDIANQEKNYVEALKA